MEEFVATVTQYHDEPIFRHAIARREDGQLVFLPGSALRKRVNGSEDYYRHGEKRDFPAYGVEVLVKADEIKKDKNGCTFQAHHWARAEG